MKNIHVLPTDKPSKLHLIEDTLIITSEYKNSVCDAEVNMYITSDEEIKDDDWVYCPVLKKPVFICLDSILMFKNLGYDSNGNSKYKKEWLKKIILTTDPDLIKDGVQAIDDEFLEWFVNNPSCEEIELEEIEKYKSTTYDQPDIEDGYNYKIIIPKEEPTISEEAKQRAKNYMSLKGALEPKDVVLGYKTSLDAKMLDSHYVNFSNPNADKITSNTTNKPIENRKTAMQQLINEIVEHLTYDDDLSDDSRMTLETIRLRCLGKLLIEKNQTLEFVSNAVRKILDEDRQNLFNLEQYYNETYKPE